MLSRKSDSCDSSRVASLQHSRDCGKCFHVASATAFVGKFDRRIGTGRAFGRCEWACVTQDVELRWKRKRSARIDNTSHPRESLRESCSCSGLGNLDHIVYTWWEHRWCATSGHEFADLFYDRKLSDKVHIEKLASHQQSGSSCEPSMNLIE